MSNTLYLNTHTHFKITNFKIVDKLFLIGYGELRPIWKNLWF